MSTETGRIRAAVERAESRIREYILETPLEHSPYLSQLGDCDVYLKLENQQRTKSFKFRGAMNKVLSLDEKVRSRGIITASTGNHGAAMAQVFNQLKVEGTVFLPVNAAPAKVQTLRLLGVRVKFFGTDCVETERLARRNAEEDGLMFVSPYNDPEIIAGQGTVAAEIARQLKGFEAVLSPVGGGGLISGVAGYLKSVSPKILQIGCQPRNSAVMYESLRAGQLLELDSKPTLADGTAGGIESGSITFESCRECVDEFLLASEDEIIKAIRLLIAKHSILVEGAGALSTACFLQDTRRFAGKVIVLIVSGARISLETLQEVLNQGLPDD